MWNENSQRKDKNLILQTLIDEASTTVTYVGKSEVGRDKDDEFWQIMKVEEIGTETIVSYADWSDDFKFSWTLRDNYNYTIN